MREVCRSRPAYGKRLLFASTLFTGLFLADLFLLARLSFSDLGRQVVDEAFHDSLDALRPAPAPTRPLLASEAPPAPGSEQECPVGDPLSRDGVTPCAVRQAAAPTGFFRSLTVRIERALTDTRGKVLWRDVWQGDLAGADADTQAHFESGHERVRETWEIRGKPQSVIAMSQPVDARPNEVREVGIPEELIEQELQNLRAGLQRRLWVGATLAVLILAIAFLYVLRLLRRTRLLEAQAQMDDRLTYIGGLAAGLAHEIRNPLNVLSMNIQMLQEDVTARLGDADGETRQVLNTLQGEIRRLSNLVDNFLSYARPSTPRFESRDLNQVIASTCQLVRPQFEAQRVVLRQELSPFLPAVDLDEGLIRQAVMNILMNAMQILKPGGTVVVSTGVAPDGDVQIGISDDGPGIAVADRERIFEVFYSNRPGGTGLGLPIAARVLAAHGGRVTVESGPAGRGARFVLRLPRRQPPEGTATPAPIAVSH